MVVQHGVIASGLGGGSSTPPPARPVNTVLPSLSGTTVVGSTLTANPGTWLGSPDTYTYQFQRNGSNVGIASSTNTYLLTTSDYNTVITVEVIATNAGGDSDVAESAGTAPITPLAPVNTVVPVISGITTSGNLLTVSNGSWSAQGTLSYSYQWKRDGVTNIGTDANTYTTVDPDDEGHEVSCIVTATNSGGSTQATASPVLITDPSEHSLTFNHVFSATTGDRGLLFLPDGYFSNTDDYGLIIWYHGQGQRGQPQDVSYTIGTGNGSTTVFSGNLTNSGARVLHSSVIIKVAGVQVATGKDGVITGTGVTGTYDRNDGSSAAYSVTFSTAPASGTITFVCTISDLLQEATYPGILNSGDNPSYFEDGRPTKCMIFCPQISRPSSAGGFVTTTEWDDIIDYIATNFRLNQNRIYPTGFSLGGDMEERILAQRPTEYAAMLACSTGDNLVPAASSGVWLQSTDRGKFWIHGTSDTTGTITAPAMMANSCNKDLEFPVQTKMFWQITHSDNAICYNRKNRTDATGTCPYDFIDLLCKFSLDSEERARYFVEWAQYTQDTGDYRLARRQVDNLTAGAVKTELDGYLVTLKATIGNYIIVDFGTSGQQTFNNNITSAAAGTTIANLKNDAGSNTSISLTLVNASAPSPGMATMQSNRLRGRQFGFEYNTGIDGMLVDAVGTVGKLRLAGSGLTGHTFTIKPYFAASTPLFSNKAEVEVTIGSDVQVLYVELNNFDFLTFTGVSPSGGQIDIDFRVNQTGATERSLYLQALEIVIQ